MATECVENRIEPQDAETDKPPQTSPTATSPKATTPTPTTPTENNGTSEEPLSKRQRKKLLKRQKWLETKAERRKREKERLKKKLEAKRAAGEACPNMRKRLKEVTMANSGSKQRVVVDMSFDELMLERHLNQCIKQISRCYSANRRVSNPLQFYVTSFEGRCVDVMARQIGWEHWDIHFTKDKYTDLFPKDDIVYLTSESRNVIDTLDDTKVYVIGGLVDHNAHKGLCLRLAEERGVRTARLPLDQHIQMRTRKVLTIDHVFRILAGVSDGRSWREMCLEAIPARKGAVGREDGDGEDGDGDGEDGVEGDREKENGKEGEDGKRESEDIDRGDKTAGEGGKMTDITEESQEGMTSVDENYS